MHCNRRLGIKTSAFSETDPWTSKISCLRHQHKNIALRLEISTAIMFTLSLLATVVALSPSIVANVAGTTLATLTTPSPIQTVSPAPYYRPRVLTVPTLSGSEGCVFSKIVIPHRTCGGGTSFASITTATLPVNCSGCTSLSVTEYHGFCPLGVTQPPLIVDTVTSTPLTRWAWSCAPSPTPGMDASEVAALLEPSVRTADITRQLPLPTLQPDETPLRTPVALSAVHHADGGCFVELEISEMDDELEDNICSANIASATVWASTMTRTIGVECDGCRYVHGGEARSQTHCLTALYRNVTQASSKVTVTETPRTLWMYDCLASATASTTTTATAGAHT